MNTTLLQVALFTHFGEGIDPRKQYLLLHFRTAYPIDSPRVHKQQQLSAQRYKHTIKLEGKEQIDAELIAWLKDAYQLAG